LIVSRRELLEQGCVEARACTLTDHHARPPAKGAVLTSFQDTLPEEILITGCPQASQFQPQIWSGKEFDGLGDGLYQGG
jgi:hypothetical protein